jgi:hypothetical protein
MYRLLRNTHLLLGLFSAVFLLMYGVSAVQMGHSRWFTLTPRVSTRDVALTPGMTDARVVARVLMDAHGLRGEVAQVSPKPSTLAFRIVRPGTVDEVSYDVATGRASIRESVARFMGMMNRLHHAAGVTHDMAALNIWGVFIGITSLSLFLIGATGIYLWFRLHDERGVGAVILAASLAYTLPILVMLRMGL